MKTFHLLGEECSRDRVICWVDVRPFCFYLSVRGASRRLRIRVGSGGSYLRVVAA